MSTLFPNGGQLDEKKCWDYWWQLGMSLEKVAAQLEADGIVSSRTGKRYTSTAVRHAAWRWALKKENQAEAFNSVRVKLATQGRIITEEDWGKILVENARFVWFQTPKRVEEFISKNGLQAYAVQGTRKE